MSDRDDVLRLFCETIGLAAAAMGTTVVIRLIAWIEARDEEEGGFLWMAGMLGYPPKKLEQMLRETVSAAPRRRQSIERKLATLDG